MAAKRYELSDMQWAKVAPLLPGKAGDPGRTGSDNRLFVSGCFVGVALGRALVRPAGALWQVEDGAPALQPLVPCRRLGTGVRRAGRRPRQPVSDDRQHHRSRPPAGGDQKRGGRRIRRWGVPEAD